jgi:hypothetical protein
MPTTDPNPTLSSTETKALSRRGFLQAAGAVTVAATGIVPSGLLAATTGTAATTEAAPSPSKTSESLVKVLFDSLNSKQKSVICKDWDFVDPKLGLLRTRVAANWHVTKPTIHSEFFTADQQKLIRDIFTSLIQPEWVTRIDRQLKDDEGGFGKQSVAIMGKPGADKFEFVLTGRHITLRCDGNSAEHVAFGGPIVYGHAASGFNEKPGHPNNIFWPQALAANSLFPMLDGKQQAQALIKQAPEEYAVGFKGPGGKLPGIAIADLSADQKKHMQTVLQKLIEPYRQSDRTRAVACLKAQGGLDACHLSFYEQDHLVDGVWDIWRLEGPSFVWHFRGSPHVHTWVHVADDASVKLNAEGNA